VGDDGVGKIKKEDMQKHPGFKAAAAKISRKEGVPMGRAKGILAAASRSASPAAKKANPRLKKVSGGY
jgi:hypothetical protein